MSSERLSALEGTILERRYRIDRVVGSGGFGVVYAGRHLTLESPIAVKVLRLDGTGDDLADRSARFLDEARTLSRLRHPNIVRVLDVGISPDADGRPVVAWLVMEWCGGRTLKDDLRERERARTVEETWSLMRPLLDAVATAHAQGIIHRDIKPSNVMLIDEPTGAASARLIDFGIAKRVDPDESAGSGATLSNGRSAFTPGYAAPEQLASLKTGAWTDVHALALLVTELLVGEPPYGKEPEASAIIDAKRPTPKAFGVEVGAWEDVLSRAMALKTAERFSDARAFLDALEQAFPAARDTAIAPPPLSARARLSARIGDASTSRPPVSTELAAAAPATGAVQDRTELGTLDVAASERDPTRSARPPSRVPLGIAIAVAGVAIASAVFFAMRGPTGGDAAARAPANTPSVESTETQAAHQGTATAPSASAMATAPASSATSAATATEASATSPSTARPGRPPFTAPPPVASATIAPSAKPQPPPDRPTLR